MSFLENIKKQTVEASNPIKQIHDRCNRMIDLFKARMEQAAVKGESEAFISRANMENDLGFDPNRQDLKNGFFFFENENITYEYKWHRDDFLLIITWQ